MYSYNVVRNQQNRDKQYIDREKRINSFTNWSQSHFLRPLDLVDNGFYYTGYKDRVRCCECGVEFIHWKEGDDIAAEHQRWSGRCEFLNKLPYGTKFVPISSRPTCTICCEKPTEIVFLSCGHAGVCGDCSARITICIFCRKKITGKVKLFLM